MMEEDCYDLVRATTGARNPNLQVVITLRRMYVASIRLDFASLKTQFDHAHFDLLPLVI